MKNYEGIDNLLSNDVLKRPVPRTNDILVSFFFFWVFLHFSSTKKMSVGDGGANFSIRFLFFLLKQSNQMKNDVKHLYLI